MYHREDAQDALNHFFKAVDDLHRSDPQKLAEPVPLVIIQTAAAVSAFVSLSQYRTSEEFWEDLGRSSDGDEASSRGGLEAILGMLEGETAEETKRNQRRALFTTTWQNVWMIRDDVIDWLSFHGKQEQAAKAKALFIECGTAVHRREQAIKNNLPESTIDKDSNSIDEAGIELYDYLDRINRMLGGCTLDEYVSGKSINASGGKPDNENRSRPGDSAPVGKTKTQPHIDAAIVNGPDTLGYFRWNGNKKSMSRNVSRAISFLWSRKDRRAQWVMLEEAVWGSDNDAPDNPERSIQAGVYALMKGVNCPLRLRKAGDMVELSEGYEAQ